MAAEETRHYLANGQATTPDAREALEWARETTAKMVDLKFCDLLGTWQHVTLPITAFDESAFDEGLGFDGSSIRGWQGISESDMLLMPDASSATLDPFTEAPTLSLICEIADPLTHEPYAKDPRRIAKRAEDYLRSSGIADTAYMGPECEFFVFDEVSYDLSVNRSHYEVDSAEGHWNSGKPGLGYTVREKEGYFPPAPHDTLSDLRTQMVLTLERLGIPCEFHHHEVGSGGQCEIDLRYQTLTRMADQVMTYKYVVKNVARAAGKSVTFMPKPIEFRCPDAAANPYLAFAAMLMAGIDGIQNGLDAGEPADWDLFEEDRGVAQVPSSLDEALDALEADHDFLTAGGVFSEELIRTWIAYKRENETDVVRLRPHPAESALHHDC